MTLTGLYSVFARPNGSDKPILLVVHGWDGDARAFSDTAMIRMASYGYFVASVGMRGRNGAAGARDASGREIYDLYDALQYIRANYADYVSPTIAAIMGLSGGGGNALAAACKFPDTFNVVVDFYGMSDYGRDGTDGWYANCNNSNYRAGMETATGGTPVAVPDAYYARDATAAIQNYSGGQLVLFHDESDIIVPVVHSQRAIAAMSGAGLSNYQANYSNSGSAVRWSHGLSWDAGPILDAEAIFMPLIAATPAWTVPATGTVTVLGYIVTKQFSVWLGNGLSEVATVAYGAVSDQYTVTPLTGSVDVTITQGAKTVTQTISSPTTLTVV